jgi:hypothetical protein
MDCAPDAVIAEMARLLGEAVRHIAAGVVNSHRAAIGASIAGSSSYTGHGRSTGSHSACLRAMNLGVAGRVGACLDPGCGASVTRDELSI